MHRGILTDEINKAIDKMQGKLVKHLHTELRSATLPIVVTLHLQKQWTHNLIDTLEIS
jgi:hypothetical protein